ncbi:uncharacterized protein [Neodiprion pinetum]|uniref:uncharacterized protein n=1 Tax=Neodiprion pinetum TaxID=441929 RepID=UPI001EDEE64F|nr:uncharacterized protein LOC124223859 [Neodiprion pinetum]
MSEQKKKKLPFVFRRIVLDDDEAGIETDAGVLCEVMINGTKNISYVPKSFLSSLGIELPKNLHDKENCSSKTVDTSGDNLERDVSIQASGSTTAIRTVSHVLLPMFNSSNATVKWDDHDTKMMLDLYAENLNHVGPFKKFKTKKKMWEHIAVDISTTFSKYVNGQQCESRFKTVRNRKGLAVTHNKQSGNDAKVVPYQQEMDNIRSIDDSVQPEVLVSVGNTRVLKQKRKEDAARGGTKKKKQDPLLAMYVELQEKKEENKERRHQEKMKIFTEYCLKKQSE